MSESKPFDFVEITSACRKALEFAFTLKRKNAGKDIPWTGPNYSHANHLSPDEALKAEQLAHAEEDQGRDNLDEVIAVILQLGIEQGRRIRRDNSSDLLDDAYGAEFLIRVGWDDQTSVRTKAGLLAVPADCLAKAIEALQHEASQVENCPRAKAIRKGKAIWAS